MFLFLQRVGIFLFVITLVSGSLVCAREITEKALSLTLLLLD